MDAVLDTAWLETPNGYVALTIWRPAARAPTSAVLISPPFAEELNKCRPMLALVGRALAGVGIATVLPDLHGTGDSAGEFGHTTWDFWRDDLQRSAQWTRDTLSPEIMVLGVRAGALLALDCDAIGEVGAFLFWAPVHSGRTHLSQFFRVQVAASASGTAANQKPLSTSELWRQLEGGMSVEVAGYEIGPALALPMSGAELRAQLAKLSRPVTWMEIVPENLSIPVSSQKVISALNDAGISPHVEIVCGPLFWSTSEIATAPDVVNRSCSLLAAQVKGQ